MIFVTVGTERFPFDRLIRAADVLSDELEGEEVYMQIGRATHRPRCPYQDFLSYGDIRAKVSQARIVIGHAGVGTLLLCAEFNKVPVMMPRLCDYGEHVDDHQSMFAERMAKKGAIVLARKVEELRGCVLEYEKRLRVPASGIEAGPDLAEHLKGVLDQMAGQRNI